MAEEEATVTDGVEKDYDDKEHHNVRSLLASEGRDFLIRNNGDEVKISELEGKTVGLYFSGSWCSLCRRFTPILAEAYKELASRNSNFEIVFVSCDEDDEDFCYYFSKMPWLAIPFSDKDKRDSLSDVLGVEGIPSLTIIDKNGKVLAYEAVHVVRDYGAEAYPFTAEKIEKLKEKEEAAKMNQTIKSLLVTTTRDFLLTSNFKKEIMSSMQSSSARSVTQARQMFCKCNLRCVLFKCYKGPNSGRKYYRCPQNSTEDDCGYFKWLDEVDHATYEMNYKLRAMEEQIMMKITSLSLNIKLLIAIVVIDIVVRLFSV